MRTIRKNCRSGAGAALIIVLAFIVLLTGVMVIFFTQALSYRTQGNSSFNDFKSTALAQSGLETVVGDLEQEIANGSTNYSFGAGTNYYCPTNNAYAIPQRSGNPAVVSGVDPVPNLVRISVRSDSITWPGVASRASQDSTTNPAASGQYISMARWNKHYLIPRETSLVGTTTIDTTPNPNDFNPPDWVYVTSVGPTNLGTGGSVITAGTPKVIGRYAYAIYNEGGLLDANVVGVPSNMATNSTPDPNPATGQLVWGSGLKGSEAFADLTVTNAVTQAPMFTQAQINQIVGWRNNATAQPTGNYATGYTFSSANAASYHDAMVTSTNGFLMTSGTNYTDPVTRMIDTDQIFPSRQSLIAFFNEANPPLPQDSLQYLGTFTRTLEQPSYNPPVGRPMVESSTNSTSNVAPFGSGNDAYGLDRASTSTNSPTDINPPMLAVRVANSFTRSYGDGTLAPVGDPLIKERFPLSRLSLIPVNEGTVTSGSTLANEIYYYFGLTPVSPGVWLYNHDPANTGGIDRLNAVASLGREPDFFELLKAAINVGSIAKGSWWYSNNFPWNSSWTSATSGILQQSRDDLTAVQILQIGANIIDQSKADNYPTRIECSGLPTVCGVEDLPYLYRFRFWAQEIPGPSSAGASAVQGQLLLLPELWNPHTPTSSSLVPPASMPKNFRVRVQPDPTANTAPITCTVTYGKGSTTATPPTLASSTISNDNIINGPNYDGITLNAPNYTGTATAAQTLTFNAGATNGYWDFREPTLLAQIKIPPGSNLAGGNPEPDVPSSGRTITGLQLALFYWYYQSYLSTTNPSLYASKLDLGSTGSNSCIRFYLDYLDPVTNAWVTYDQQQYQIDALDIAINQSPIASFQSFTGNSWGGGGRVDPRTSRWDYHINEYMNYIPAINLADDEFGTYRPDGTISFGDHVGNRDDAGFVGAASSYNGVNGLGDGYQGFQSGYWAENSTRKTAQITSEDPETGVFADLRYNLDPDGVPRRAMAGYVTDATEGGQAASTSQPLTGLPLATGTTTTSGADTPYDSRPTMLHRPFRSVAELGYVFRDTPWGNINFTFPESGDSALLDVFCVNDTSSTAGLVAGKVDLNTRQAPVLAALMSNTVLDKDNSTTSPTPTLTQLMASQLATQLVARTTTNTVTSTTQGPLMSRADLVGTWMGSTTPTASGTALKNAASAYAINPDTYYTGFSHDIGTTVVPSVNGTPTVALIPRQRDSVMRGLVDSGTTRTWNLLIDLVAQSGRFPPKSTGFSNFVVEGEKHYWLHVAIDHYTGKVIASQLEVVRE